MVGTPYLLCGGNRHCFYCARHLGNLHTMLICYSRGRNTLQCPPTLKTHSEIPSPTAKVFQPMVTILTCSETPTPAVTITHLQLEYPSSLHTSYMEVPLPTGKLTTHISHPACRKALPPMVKMTNLQLYYHPAVLTRHKCKNSRRVIILQWLYAIRESPPIPFMMLVYGLPISHGIHLSHVLLP